MLTTTCDLYAKEDDLHAQWVRETRGIRAIAMSLSVSLVPVLVHRGGWLRRVTGAEGARAVAGLVGAVSRLETLRDVLVDRYATSRWSGSCARMTANWLFRGS